MKHPIEPPSADRKLLYPRIFHEPLQVVGGARMATIQSYIHERELYVNSALYGIQDWYALFQME